MTQAQVAEAAGLAPSTASEAERGKGVGFTVRTWARLAMAVGVDLRAYLERASSAGQPRDIVHLRNQELLVRVAAAGGWSARPEEAIDDPAHGTRSVDVLLTRRGEFELEMALLEVFDWFDDVGAAARSWDRRLARVEARASLRLPPPPMVGDGERLPRVSGCWIVRATLRNRELIAAHAGIFRARFPWLVRRVAPRPGRAIGGDACCSGTHLGRRERGEAVARTPEQDTRPVTRRRQPEDRGGR